MQSKVAERRLLAIRKKSIFGVDGEGETLKNLSEKTPQRVVLEAVAPYLGVVSIAMDANGLWHLGKTKLTWLDGCRAWYSPAGTYPVKIGVLPTNVDCRKSLEFLEDLCQKRS